MLIENGETPQDFDFDPAIPTKFYTARDAAKLIPKYAFECDGVDTLQTFRIAHNSGFTIAAVCERACRYIARDYDHAPEQRKAAIKFACEYATRVARLYGELRRNRRYEWR